MRGEALFGVERESIVHSWAHMKFSELSYFLIPHLSPFLPKNHFDLPVAFITVPTINTKTTLSGSLHERLDQQKEFR